MLSAVKVLFTLLVIWIVWTLFKYRHRIAEVRQAVKKAEADLRRRAEARARRGGGANARIEAQDLEQCPKCGAYVAEGAVCGCQKG